MPEDAARWKLRGRARNRGSDGIKEKTGAENDARDRASTSASASTRADDYKAAESKLGPTSSSLSSALRSRPAHLRGTSQRATADMPNLLIFNY